MLLIEWSDELSVGIASIDEQHKKLVNMLNALHDASLQGEDEQILIDIFQGLAIYMDHHFSYEEGLLDSSGYRELESHKQSHAELAEEVWALKRAFENGEQMVTATVMDFLKEWLQKHILGTDQRSSQFLLEQGVQ